MPFNVSNGVKYLKLKRLWFLIGVAVLASVAVFLAGIDQAARTAYVTLTIRGASGKVVTVEYRTPIFAGWERNVSLEMSSGSSPVELRLSHGVTNVRFRSGGGSVAYKVRCVSEPSDEWVFDPGQQALKTAFADVSERILSE